jgi:hypothetical protein
MNIGPFDQPGSFYRGNLHTHSTASDGARSPRAVCYAYRRRGYDFISLTDHFVERYGYPVSDTRPFRTDGFTTVIGAEVHTPATSLGDDWHILAVGLPLDFAPTEPHETGAALAARARDAGAYVAAAHPAWYDLTDADVQALTAASAIEIFNTTCQVSNGKGDSVGYLDRLLSQGHYYHAIATDDAHMHEGRPDVGRNWVMVRSSHLEPAALLEALHAGNFYASQGPEILDVKVARGGKKLTVHTSPVRRMCITGAGASSDNVAAGADFTSAELGLANLRGPYARITVTDKRGNRAWTNPFEL